ncbi:hypothetical protein D187_004414 [Cystobacter fuscus DSM 2262]|uniref:Uncharacterized protein n=1 Tax=Cystobacter fuscus (strain ATCC 25194 / DSM 2262 / NBRC 100088 / M29) TaxID=1242864 RepID=S9P122_CYSF2|nr:hypothetical protein [Cystobacter fuscus]EPX58125.1 hypothetical protein D187_004414 [Cystobacter fuscus DSM 2262]
MMELLKKLYEPHAVKARARLDTDPALCRLLSPSIEPRVLERFLIEWMARAVYMTEPVDGWIRRTGQRCIEQGMEKIGNALIIHAKSETGHHLMTLEDTHALVKHWNAHQPPPALTVEQLLAQPPTDAMKAYRQLHDETIEGAFPVGQIAIEREVGYLAVYFGPRLMKQVDSVLGTEVSSLLSFMAEHVAVDVGHTLLNEKLLEEAISRSPEHARLYAEAGARALNAYIRFLGDCLRIAEHLPSPLRSVA